METLKDLFNALQNYIERLGENAFPKAIITFMISTIAFLCGEINAALVAFFVVLALDMLTGIWAAHKRGDRIESEVAKKGAVKIIIYFILIILGHSLQLMGLPFTRSAALIYASLTEGKSILENLEYISGGLPLITHLNQILNKYAKEKNYDQNSDEEEKDEDDKNNPRGGGGVRQ